MAFHHSRDSLFIATTEMDYMQCAEAALNKDFWHNLCAANTSLSRNIVAEIGQTIATYAVNLSIER